MTDIKPIETTYKGFRFRSRLEARWAVFFDALGIGWEYEPQGYAVEGRPYLIDFWLPGESTWAEVKPSSADNFEGEHVDLCRGLADGTGDPVVLLVGVPEVRMYNRFTPGLSPGSYSAAYFRDYAPHLGVADKYWLQCVDIRAGDGAMVFRGDDRRLRKALGPGLLDAVNAARSARFEHGEAGAET